MIEVLSGLFVGAQADYERRIRHERDWRVVHACKEPYHRAALGYTGQGAPKEHPEYLIARREHRLILNLVDAPDPRYIRKEIVDAALEFIQAAQVARVQVLVHCNLGESRAPSLVLIYLASKTDKLPKASLAEAETSFRSVYPQYNPGKGMRGFLEGNWRLYCGK